MNISFTSGFEMSEKKEKYQGKINSKLLGYNGKIAGRRECCSVDEEFFFMIVC